MYIATTVGQLTFENNNCESFINVYKISKISNFKIIRLTTIT